MFPKDKLPNAMKEARQAANMAGLIARDKKSKSGKYEPAKIEAAKTKKQKQRAEVVSATNTFSGSKPS